MAAARAWARLVWQSISRHIFRENSFSTLRPDKFCLAMENTGNARPVETAPIRTFRAKDFGQFEVFQVVYQKSAALAATYIFGFVKAQGR